MGDSLVHAAAGSLGGIVAMYLSFHASSCFILMSEQMQGCHLSSHQHLHESPG
ncbi:hypothetical protein BT69DRAFT_1290961 [Atractiella rhizophila]|nr:hypothetical protein BT69DRAFT_1290961 [Atractiella rhizophila]